MQIKKSEFETSSAKVSQCPETDLPEFAFIGRSNVGKSSLLNMIMQRKGLAKTAATPGKTRLINHFKVNDELYFVDLPGYGYAKVAKTERAAFMKMIYSYFEKRENMLNAFVLVDSRHEAQKSDIEFMNWLGQHGIPFSVVMTKIDKLSSSDLNKSKLTYQKKMKENWDTLPPFFYTSSSNRHGRDELLTYIDYCLGLQKEG
ncbi:MAG: YihA family ribosome biogenesis GTP-binding protein [Flavobacteriales bacterium]|jgi:GTP-binding protein|nr:YihA family ribosome biogenesis GTP-binding protein [Flavobacteriales bacterium]NCG29261.1 YihA family ribosome biogenesis GTP-binding protein [Bacteroidota bacterium]MBT3964366.1 YihA family ribosome biogenesis GTP-binding protein [Flavobacteriales bacterium]MBT4705150.1 YihA family ribosome biogenesis GTP-binding protein [Flavobacteriales bacterium]MBT4930170.1 YihA family ribosome biogenesis GTP-binding protein [Flavobacteriales bacterium]